jgi:hypothetical protein
LDFVAYLRIYVRGKDSVEDATKEVCRVLRDVDFALDGLYDLRVVLADSNL